MQGTHGIWSHNDYREFLGAVLKSRISNNPRYSLRAFARSLSIAPQVLSPLLKKKRRISLEVAAQISVKLGLEPLESAYFSDLVSLANAKADDTRRIAEFRILQYTHAQESYEVIQHQLFNVISEWEHIGILELISTKNFISEPAWIAGRLGIGQAQVEQAIKRLISLNIVKEEDGKLVRVKTKLATEDELPSGAVRKFSSQILKKAEEALEKQTLDERSISTITMAIDPKKIPEAKKLIRGFRRKLCKLLENGDQTEVYSMSLALFRLTQDRSLS